MYKSWTIVQKDPGRRVLLLDRHRLLAQHRIGGIRFNLAAKQHERNVRTQKSLRVEVASTEASSLQKGRRYLECVNQSGTYVCSILNIIFIIKDGEINGDTPVLVNSRQVICQVKGIFIEIGIVDWVIKPGKP